MNQPVKIFINNDVTINRCCYLFLFQQRKLHSFFQHEDFEIIKNPQDADYIIVISCVVAGKFKDKTKELLDTYNDSFPEKQIVCYGCFSHLEDQTKLYEGQNISFVDNDNIDAFNEIFPHPGLPKFSEVVESSDAVFENNFDERNGWITIGHGCLWDCYYCNHKLTKKLKSKPKNLIVFELKKRLAEGIDHFRFIGDDVASYGYDLPEKIEFISLLHELLEVNDDFTFSLGPIYPKIFLQEKQGIIDLLRTGRVTEIFVAIEHISKRMLKKMNRYYDIEELLDFVTYLKKQFPEIKISTHILYGFPGETSEDFKQIFRVTDYFDQVQFFEMGYNEYLRKKVPDFVKNPKEIETKKEIITRYYSRKEGFITHFDNRVVVLKESYKVDIAKINSYTF